MRNRFKAVASRAGGAVAPIGNLILATTWADFLTKYAAAVSGDVVSINHGGYTPTTPQVFNANHPVGGGGATFIGASNQIVQLVIDGQTALKNEFVNWYCDIDSVNGNETSQVASVASSGYCRNSDSFAIRGCVFTRGMWGLYNYNNSNFVEENNVCQFQRADAMRLDVNPAQFQIKGNYFGNVSTNGKMWWYTDGTAPVFNIDPGTGTFYDKEHNDGIQAFFGAMTDAEITYNTFYIQGQVCFIADTTGNPQLRVNFSNNTLQGADPYQLLFDNGSHITCIGNAFSAMPVMSPGISDVKITIAGSNIRYGQNTVATGGYGVAVTYVGVTEANFISGSITGTATGPTAPTWTGTTSNVGNLAVLRGRKTPAAVPNPPIPVSLPVLLSNGTNTVGVKVTGRPPLWNPYTPGMEDNLYSRFKLDGAIVRASTQGRAAMVYTTAAAGALTVEFSSDNAVWSTPSAPMAIASAGTTLDPADKSANITLSNGNLTATHSGTDATHALAKSIADIPFADGNYVWKMNCSTQISGTQSGFAIIGNAKSNNIDPHDFDGPCLAVFGNGAMYGSGGLSLSNALGNMGGAGKSYADGDFLWYLRRTGATSLLFCKYPDGTWATGGGDPTGAGAGINVSAALGSNVLSAPAYTYKTGDVTTMTYSFSTTGLGTVITL